MNKFVNTVFVGKEKAWATFVAAGLTILGNDELATLVGENWAMLSAVIIGFTTWVVPNSTPAPVEETPVDA